jgi:predicted AAA+ superfamily ATPase
MIPRLLHAELKKQLTEFPIVTVLGPRQAGKTTLARKTLPAFEYVSLEDPETLSIATEDPRAFLAQREERVIFDEIQRAPQLLSYLQGIVDEKQENGRFVLTGSHQLELREAIGQSLAGRTGMLQLLPLSIPELESAQIRFDRFEDYLLHGFLPRVHAHRQRPRIAYASYYQTYVERDVRRLIQLRNATLFESFLKLLAGRVGQLVNLSSLANDVGVDAKTIRSWLSILEASFVVFRLPPYHRNFGKRVVKAPKIYFTDTGLLCYLLGIEEARQVTRDPLVGGLFENLVVLEALKARYNAARTPGLSFFRDSNGNELDLLLDSGRELRGIEIKSASTYNASFKKNLNWFRSSIAELHRAAIVYNGAAQRFGDGIEALPVTRAHELFASNV